MVGLDEGTMLADEIGVEEDGEDVTTDDCVVFEDATEANVLG